MSNAYLIWACIATALFVLSVVLNVYLLIYIDFGGWGAFLGFHGHGNGDEVAAKRRKKRADESGQMLEPLTPMPFAV